MSELISSELAQTIYLKLYVASNSSQNFSILRGKIEDEKEKNTNVKCVYTVEKNQRAQNFKFRNKLIQIRHGELQLYTLLNVVHINKHFRVI